MSYATIESDAASQAPVPSYTGAAYDPRELVLLIHAFLEGRSTFDTVEQAARTLCASLADQQVSVTSVEMVLRGVVRAAANDTGVDLTSLPAQLVLWQIPRWIGRATRGPIAPVATSELPGRAAP